MNLQQTFEIMVFAQRTSFIISVVSLIVVFLSLSLILEDNNSKCWYQLIPFYNTYTYYKTFWKSKYFWVYLIVSVLFIFSFGISLFAILSLALNNPSYYLDPEVILGSVVVAGIVIAFILLIIMGILGILLIYNLSKLYDFDGGFTIGLLLLPAVFYFILGIKCLKREVMRIIPTGRKIFMVVMVVLIILIAILYYQNFLTDAALLKDIGSYGAYIK